MKINHLDTPAIAATRATERKAAAPAASPTVAPESSAHVAISPAAALMAQATEGGSFDVAKVQRVAAAIADGSYRVNAEAIADKMLANAAEWLGHKRN